MKKLLCIVGPTATGKTDIALEIGKKLGGELIACDSRQVYRGLDIGTGKLPGGDVAFERHDGYWIIDGVKIWLYDKVEPSVQYDVWQYVHDSREIIQTLSEQNILPIVVGGTGLYLRGLLEGFDQMNVPINDSLRAELELLPLPQIQEKLAQLDPDFFSSLNHSEVHNKRRLIRKIELLSHPQDQAVTRDDLGIGSTYHVLKIGITAAREILYQRIDQRVIKRVEMGMIEEAQMLHQEGLSFERMREFGLEYTLLADLLSGRIHSTDFFINELQQRIHHYAKRQMTWFRRDPEIEWFDLTESDFSKKVASRVEDWYNG